VTAAFDCGLRGICSGRILWYAASIEADSYIPQSDSPNADSANSECPNLTSRCGCKLLYDSADSLPVTVVDPVGELSESVSPAIGTGTGPVLPRAIHQKLRPVLRHWLALYEIGHMPRRADLDATAFASCLSDVMLLKVIDHGADFRYDLYGENLRNIFAVTYLGKTLRHVAFDGFEKLIAEYAHVAITAEPFYVERRQISERDFMSVTVAKLILPLSDDGCSVSDLLVSLTRID